MSVHNAYAAAREESEEEGGREPQQPFALNAASATNGFNLPCAAHTNTATNTNATTNTNTNANKRTYTGTSMSVHAYACFYVHSSFARCRFLKQKRPALTRQNQQRQQRQQRWQQKALQIKMQSRQKAAAAAAADVDSSRDAGSRQQRSWQQQPQIPFIVVV